MSDWLKLIADNDQDEAACRQWWRESTNAAKLRVWELIQKEYDDPAMEIVSRFAQLAFARAAAEYTGAR